MIVREGGIMRMWAGHLERGIGEIPRGGRSGASSARAEGVRKALLAAFAAVLAAQDTRYSARSQLVVVPVNVTDAKGAPVPNLLPSDFVVLDDGRARKVSVESIDTGVAPIALMIAVESAGISRAALENVRRIGAMIQPLVTGDRGCAGVVSFAERLNWLEECTKDPDALKRAFARIETSGQQTKARMLDAASSAIERLRRRENVRRVLLLISETRDRGSETPLEMVAADALTAGVMVYAVTYSAFATAFSSKAPVGDQRPAKTPTTPSEASGTYNGAPPNRWNPKIPPPEQRVDILGGIRELGHMSQPNAVGVLTRATGGATFSFVRRKGLEDAIRKFGEDLHSQYLLTFVPDQATPGYHVLDVRLRRSGLQVRARPGYRVAESK